MTLRLVALMSIVLLLSLAAFGLLTAHYQQQVMDEVARTASAVGKATLRTLEQPAGAAGAAQAGATTMKTEVLWVRSAGPDAPAPGRPLRRTMFLRSGEPAPEEIHEQRSVHTFVLPHPGGAVEAAGSLCAEIRARCDAEPGDFVAAASVTADVLVDVEEVRVDSMPAEGQLVLRIPTFHPFDGAAGGNPSKTWIAADGSTPPLVEREIALPISTGDYADLFSSLRRRSLYLFLGVFLVGTALSAGVASRFTRPARRLDAGIRRLSEGDLDARVDVRGRDEIARLGAAFNEMATKLRANRDRTRELVRREKLSALGGLAAGVAHDVRNPLHSIGLTLQHLSETGRPEAEDRALEFDRSLELIRAEIRRLDHLVVNFLRFARTDRRERQPVDLAALLRETSRLIHKEAEWRGVEVGHDLLETAPAVLADGEAIRSSVLNLVLNSFDAMPGGGKLTLGLRVDADHVVLEVTDTGRGIPEEERERVFEFAYTTREGGTGLGLAMVHHAVVEGHGGRVAIDSAPGRGTRVSLSLPIRTPERDGLA